MRVELSGVWAGRGRSNIIIWVVGLPVTLGWNIEFIPRLRLLVRVPRWGCGRVADAGGTLLGPEATHVGGDTLVVVSDLRCHGRPGRVIGCGGGWGWLFENCTVDASIFDLLWSSV